MPMKFSDLKRKVKPATLDLGDGDIIAFTFRHALITPAFVETLLSLDGTRLQAAGAVEAGETVRAVSEQVARVVASWDVLDEDDATPFPLDAARLAAEIPLSIQIGLLFKCMQEMQPGEAIAPGTSAASSPTTSRPSGATSSLAAR